MERKLKFLHFVLLTASLSTLSLSALAAGGGGHGSVRDLFWPAVNFFVLFGTLFLLTKRKIAEAFKNQAKDVAELFEVAEKKHKEANIKLDMYQRKMKDFPAYKEKMLQDTNLKVEDFKQKAKAETANRIDRLTKETEDRLINERNSLIQSMNMELLNRVVGLTKDQIGSNEEKRGKATERLVSSIN